MKIVCEIAQSHEGSLGTALAYIQAIAAAGADAAKFQCHDGDACNKFRAGTWFPQDVTREAYWHRTSFKPAEWSDIAEACHDHGIEFICSPFSMQAFENMAQLVDRWKIASSKVHDHELIDACVATGKPVILSSGMSDDKELEAAVKRIPKATVLQCTSLYPCPPEKINVNRLDWLYYDGMSDHSGTIWPSIAAAVHGWSMAEVHVVFARECFGPDVSSSITIPELRQLVEGVRFIEKMLAGSKDKDEMALELASMRETFR